MNDTAETLREDHLTALRAVAAAGGRLRLRDIVEAVRPGTNALEGASFMRSSLAGCLAVGELQRWGLLANLPRSLDRVLTDAGRAALAGAGVEAAHG